MRHVAIVLILLLVGLMTYIRLSPTDATLWHQMPQAGGPGDDQTEGSFRAVRQITAPTDDVLTAIQAQAESTPRTRLIAGSVEEGVMTFQTRSAIWGFPDYTTVAVQGDLLVIYARLRFGRADMGVNRARVMAWLDALGPLTAPL